MKKVELRIPCIHCKKIAVFQAPEKGLIEWQQGKLIQDALPSLSDDERELLISQTCPKCFDKIADIEEDETPESEANEPEETWTDEKENPGATLDSIYQDSVRVTEDKFKKPYAKFGDREHKFLDDLYRKTSGEGSSEEEEWIDLPEISREVTVSRDLAPPAKTASQMVAKRAEELGLDEDDETTEGRVDVSSDFRDITQANPAPGIRQVDYRWFVIDKQGRPLSGWEYKQDAIDASKDEVSEENFRPSVVYVNQIKRWHLADFLKRNKLTLKEVPYTRRKQGRRNPRIASSIYIYENSRNKDDVRRFQSPPASNVEFFEERDEGGTLQRYKLLRIEHYDDNGELFMVNHPQWDKPLLKKKSKANAKRQKGFFDDVTQGVYNHYRDKPWAKVLKDIWNRGEGRLILVPDETADMDNLKGDTFNPEVNKDIPREKLEAEEKDFEQRVEREGVWGAVAEFYIPDEDAWEEIDTIWGFVGGDFIGSGYDEDMAKALIRKLRGASFAEDSVNESLQPDWKPSVEKLKKHRLYQENPREIRLLVDGHHGIYVPQVFAKRYDMGLWNVKKEDAEVLLAGPDHEHYWETWDDVLDYARYYILLKNGEKRVHHLEQDGDLFSAWDDDENEGKNDENEELSRPDWKPSVEKLKKHRLYQENPKRNLKDALDDYFGAVSGFFTVEWIASVRNQDVRTVYEKMMELRREAKKHGAFVGAALLSMSPGDRDHWIAKYAENFPKFMTWLPAPRTFAEFREFYRCYIELNMKTLINDLREGELNRTHLKFIDCVQKSWSRDIRKNPVGANAKGIDRYVKTKHDQLLKERAIKSTQRRFKKKKEKFGEREWRYATGALLIMQGKRRRNPKYVPLQQFLETHSIEIADMYWNQARTQDIASKFGVSYHSMLTFIKAKKFRRGIPVSNIQVLMLVHGMKIKQASTLTGLSVRDLRAMLNRAPKMSKKEAHERWARQDAIFPKSDRHLLDVLWK